MPVRERGQKKGSSPVQLVPTNRYNLSTSRKTLTVIFERIDPLTGKSRRFSYRCHGQIEALEVARRNGWKLITLERFE